VVGLGNPGAAYEDTRHNAGFMLADALAAHWEFGRFRRPWRWRARVAEGTVDGRDIVIVKPQTYMNRSGAALGPLLAKADFDPSRHLLVAVDELALRLGTFRIRARGSAGGHNGLKSVAGRLQSEEYPRLRIGVGPRHPDQDGADFVLSPFEAAERKEFNELLPDLCDAVHCWVTEGIEPAMNRYNRRGTQSE
jgi:PTH1 family peptidyl-tRNA hydrolase